MEFSLTHIILTVLGLLGGGLGTFLINAYTSKRQKDLEVDDLDGKQKLAENDQAVHIYKDLVETIMQWANKCDKNNELIMDAITAQRSDSKEMKIGFTNMSIQLNEVLTHLKPKP